MKPNARMGRGTRPIITFDNLLLREILSDPSGTMIQVSDEDIIEELFSNSDINEAEKEDDLADLFG